MQILQVKILLKIHYKNRKFEVKSVQYQLLDSPLGGGVSSLKPWYAKIENHSAKFQALTLIPIDFFPFIFPMIKETKVKEWQPKILNVQKTFGFWTIRCFTWKEYLLGLHLWFRYQSFLKTYFALKLLKTKRNKLKLELVILKLNSVTKYILIDTYHK